MRWLNGITDSMDMSVSKPREVVMDMTEWLNWTEGRHLVGGEKLKYEFRKEGCKISNW